MAKRETSPLLRRQLSVNPTSLLAGGVNPSSEMLAAYEKAPVAVKKEICECFNLRTRHRFWGFFQVEQEVIFLYPATFPPLCSEAGLYLPSEKRGCGGGFLSPASLKG